MSKIDILYDEVNDALRRIGVENDAAEIHGGLCGLFCTIGGLTVEYWLDTTLTTTAEDDALTIDALSNESRSLLTLLFNGTEKQLSGQDFSFSPFLPDDDAGLAARIEALSHWCQGFLFGLSQGGLTNPDGLPGDLPEIVRDLIEISRAESYELDDDDQNEKDYMELIEFTRVAVQLFIDEMQQFQVDEPEDEADYH